jgi:transcriptional regulator with GAF, ATPase, and Fis domain
MNPRIIGIVGPFKGTVLSLGAEEVSIGRESSNQLWIADPALSRRHCVLIPNGGQFTLRDVGSRNGTQVNGMPIDEQHLQHGDQISIGDSLLVFLLEEREAKFESNTVELVETGETALPAVLLKQEDALYLQPDKVIVALPQTARMARDLNSLLKISTAIGAIRDWDSLQWQLLGFIFDVVPAERGAVLLFDHPDLLDSTAAWDRVRGPRHPVRVSRAVLHRVFRERVGVLVEDVSGDQMLRQSRTLTELEVRSLLCVPLTVSGEVVGAIYLDHRAPDVTFDENHLQVMTAMAAIASLALDNVRHWERLQQENKDLRAEINLEHNMVGTSAPMRQVFEFIRRVAPTDSTVLIQGESGTGKELVAHALHRNSPRAERPFVAINCAAITETLLESELFGHEKGSFTGAIGQKKGMLEVADGGTLFLDEVSEMVPSLQSKVLRVLQEREFERVGGTRTIKVDIRVIAATNKSLTEAVESGAFRRDLYYRLNVVAVTMPNLRARPEDIELLAQLFIAKASRKCKTRIKPLSPEALACLMSYDWPGNVRELENAIERALVLGTADVILPEDLPEAVLEAGSTSPASNAKYQDAIRDFKKQLVQRALQQGNDNYLEAARALGMHPNSLLRLIRNLGLRAAKAGVPSEKQ